MKGNEYYKLRKIFKRDKKVSVEDIINESEKYFHYVDTHPYIKVKRDGDKTIEEEFIKPYTIEGLCRWLGISRQTLLNLEKEKEYLDVIMCVRETIRENKLEGATAGYFNSNIVARDLKLRDKDDSTIIVNQVTPLSIDEIKELSNKVSGSYGDIPNIIDLPPLDSEKTE